MNIRQIVRDVVDVIVFSVVGVLTVIAVHELEIDKTIVSLRDKVINLHHYKATFNRALIIYAKLRKHTGIPSQIPDLYLDRSTTVNAYVSARVMVITQGMLDHAKSDSDLAYVLGHEMGHTMLYHTTVRQDRRLTDSRIHEANADKIAVYLMVRTGYNICNIGDLWKRTGHTN